MKNVRATVPTGGAGAPFFRREEDTKNPTVLKSEKEGSDWKFPAQNTADL